jgi:hypothetical protein
MSEIYNFHNKIYNEYKNNGPFCYIPYELFVQSNRQDPRKSKYIVDHIINNKIIIDLLNIDGNYFISEKTDAYLINDSNVTNYLYKNLNSGGFYTFPYAYETSYNEIPWKSIIFNNKIIKVKQFNIIHSRNTSCQRIPPINYDIKFENFISFNIKLYNPEDHIIPNLTLISDPFYKIINDLKNKILELNIEISKIKSENKKEILELEAKIDKSIYDKFLELENDISINRFNMNNMKSESETQIATLKTEMNNIKFKDMSIDFNKKNKESCDMIKLNDYQ